jgi:hypothetical protein
VRDPELFRKSIHELGTIFYQKDDEDNINLIVYFSGSRIVQYNGKVEEGLAKLVRSIGYNVSSIDVDEVQGYVKIVQG